MLLTLIVLVIFFEFVVADGYICAGNQLINPPLDLNQPVYFPENWNEGFQPATFNAPQMCNWQINVPDGMYATAMFYKDVQGAAFNITNILVTYSNKNDFRYLNDNDEAPFIFTAQQFQVDLRAYQMQGRFSFKIVWSYYPKEICKTNIPLDQSQLTPSPYSNCLTTFTAPNRVWLVGLAKTIFPERPAVLRHSAVFEGGSTDGKFLGTLYEAANNNILSAGRSLSVYTFGMQLQDNRNLFVGMDITAAGDVRSFSGLDCTDTPNYCYIYASAFDKSVYPVITASRNVDYLYQPVKFNENGTFRIYETQIDNDHLLATFNGTDYNQQLPIAVKNTVKIYKMDLGSAQFFIANDATQASYGSIGILRDYGMRRIVHSFDYRQLSLQQDTFENFTTYWQLVDFNFNIVYFDVNGPTTLEIKVYQSNNVVYSEKFNSQNFPLSSTYKVQGDTISVNYQTYGFRTKGFEVNFVCTKNDEVPTTTKLPPATSPSTAAQSSTKNDEIPTTTKLPPATSLSTAAQSSTSVKLTTPKVITTTTGSSQNFGFTCFVLFAVCLAARQ